mmetsp:Transcript_58080/g.189092  ORF Transcript_58080/g.189092 Transcript_58080/m.189092 type:complete len:230 (+) Transcript_58080:256-945(+)
MLPPLALRDAAGICGRAPAGRRGGMPVVRQGGLLAATRGPIAKRGGGAVPGSGAVVRNPGLVVCALLHRALPAQGRCLLLAIGVPLVVALRGVAREELRAEHALLPCEGGHCPLTFCEQAFKLCDPHTIRQIVTHVGSPRSRFLEALLLQLAHLGAQGTVQHCMAVGPGLGILQQLLQLRDHHAFVASLPVLPRLSGAGCRKLLPEDLCGLCILCFKGLAVKRAWVLPL